MQKEIARAKINLTLHVGRVIENQADAFYGYHPLDSLVVFSDIGDVLTCEKADTTHLSITGPFAADLPNDERNLILKAVDLIDRKSEHPALHFTLEKNLPVAAGIGGGSANAAATLRLLKAHIDMDESEWQNIALQIGADVPVCLASKTARMTGIGETVSLAPGLGQIWSVLVNPGAEVLTRDVFRALDAGTPKDTPRPAKMSGDLLSRALDGRNDLQPPAIDIEPSINVCLRALASSQGCQLARMSGSGATCFGLYGQHNDAQRAAKALLEMHPKWWVQPALLGDPA